MTTGIVARLANRRSGRSVMGKYAGSYRVFCGRHIDGRAVCGQLVGHVFCGEGDAEEPNDEPHITLLPGWVEGEEGVWSLSRHAVKELHRTQQIASGRDDGTGPVSRAAGPRRGHRRARRYPRTRCRSRQELRENCCAMD